MRRDPTALHLDDLAGLRGAGQGIADLLRPQGILDPRTIDLIRSDGGGEILNHRRFLNPRADLERASCLSIYFYSPRSLGAYSKVRMIVSPTEEKYSAVP